MRPEFKKDVGKKVRIAPVVGDRRYNKLPTTTGTILGIYNYGQKVHEKTIEYCLGLKEGSLEYAALLKLQPLRRTFVFTVEMEVIIFDVWPGETRALILLEVQNGTL